LLCGEKPLSTGVMACVVIPPYNFRSEQNGE
jgi:hypothetical protein